MKVSVIIPFYKVAPFIERCVRSLMEQTLLEVEFIFVDDASPDESANILQKVLSEYSRDAQIVRHECNRGLPAARNTGMALAKGEFIYHCDSDDFLEADMLEQMYGTATETGADYVYCDYYLDFGSSQRAMRHTTFSNPQEMVKQGFLAGPMKYNVWNKMVRRELYEDLVFPEGHSIGEDMTMIPLALRAKRVCCVSRPLYHYSQTNQGAMTRTVPIAKTADIAYNLSRTLSLLASWEDPEKDQYLAFFKLNTKLPFLFSGDSEQYRLWRQWYPEANAFIWQNRYLPFRTKMVQLFAKWNLFSLVRLYGWAVDRMYYGLFYRK